EPDVSIKHTLRKAALKGGKKDVNHKPDDYQLYETGHYPWSRELFRVTPEMYQLMCECLKKPTCIATATRPGLAFIANFLHYYQIARHSDREHTSYKELLALLRLSRFYNSQNFNCLREVLLQVVINRDVCPTFEELNSGDLE